MPNITEMLDRVRAGDSSASDELMQAVYGELHRIARQHLRNERPSHTLQPTALVNEAYVRLFGGSLPELSGRAHFLALASRIMRRILVDYARTRASAQRGGGMLVDTTIDIDPTPAGAIGRVDLLDLDLALESLAAENPALTEVIELRYFGGLTAQETAEVCGRSVNVVEHDLRYAHAWLRRRLGRPAAASPKSS